MKCHSELFISKIHHGSKHSYSLSQHLTVWNSSWYYLKVTFFQTKGIVPKSKLDSEAKSMQMNSRVLPISQNGSHFLHIIRSEYLIVRVINIAIISPILESVQQNNVYLPTSVIPASGPSSFSTILMPATKT